MYLNPQSNRRLSRGVSLTETLVVVVLIVTIVALLMPVFESSRNTAKLAVCSTNLKQIYNGLVSQSIKNKAGLMPNPPRLWEGYAEALVESDVMICPMETTDHFKLEDDKYNFLPTPPPSIEEGQFNANNVQTVFREKAAHRLESDVDAIVEPGLYGEGGKSYTNNGVIVGSPLGSETEYFYDSYLFSYDPRDNNNEGKDGEVHFGANSEVQGIFCSKEQLDASRLIFGNPDVIYPTSATDGCFNMESNRDSVEIPTHRKTVRHASSWAVDKSDDGGNACVDQFRVVTNPGSGSSYAMNVEVPSHPANDMQILLVDAKVPWVEFTDGTDDHSFAFADTIDARHFGKVNTMTVQGSVEIMELEKLRPDSIYWRR